jgi:hypothetical protein
VQIFRYSYLEKKPARAARQPGRTSGQGNVRRSGGGDMAEEDRPWEGPSGYADC